MAVDPVVSLVAALVAAAARASTSEVAAATTRRVQELLRSHAEEAPNTDDALEAREALEAVKENPDDPQRQRDLQEKLFDIVISDNSLASNLAQVADQAKQDETLTSPSLTHLNGGLKSSVNGTSIPMQGNQPERQVPNGKPVRGFPGLTVSAASAQTTAGSDFSIFVLVQNPFDVPITIHHVQTHIPVDLVDVNRWRAKIARLSLPAVGDDGKASSAVNENGRASRGAGEDGKVSKGGFLKRMSQRRRLWREHPGVATAVGTEITPQEAGSLFRSEIHAARDIFVQQGGSVSAVSFVMPSNPSSDALDALMRRVIDYRRGTLPVRLQPGDSVVRQFVLRTRSRIFFRPLSHSFQIQVSYSVDGEDHTGTIPYDLTIQAALGSISAGSVVGAVLGTLVKSFSHPSTTSIAEHPLGILQALAVSVMASVAVVIAFARKSSAQPLVSIEDFWGGLVIGFTVGYFGFQSFFGLFKSSG